jgi:hypothetical protein
MNLPKVESLTDPWKGLHASIMGSGPNVRIYQGPREWHAQLHADKPRLAGSMDAFTRTGLSLEGGQFRD